MTYLEIKDENNNRVPFCVVPDEWVDTSRGKFRFQTPEGETITMCAHSPAKSSDLWFFVKTGAEHLVDHKEVATFPEGRAVVERRAK